MVAAPLLLSPLVFFRRGSHAGPWKVAASEGEGSGQREGSPGPQKGWRGSCARGRLAGRGSCLLSHSQSPGRHLQGKAKGEQIQVSMKIKAGTLLKGYSNEVFSSEATLPLPLSEAPNVQQQLQIFIKNLD